VRTKKPLIAIVDDDESVCRALERLLRSLGLAAESYASGADFMHRLEAFPVSRPDCVILDAQMPDMNGIEVQARLAGVRQHIPVARWLFCENLAMMPCLSEPWRRRWKAGRPNTNAAMWRRLKINHNLTHE